MPSTGHRSNAFTNASPSAFSAPATSPEPAARKAISRPYELRPTASFAACAAVPGVGRNLHDHVAFLGAIHTPKVLMQSGIGDDRRWFLVFQDGRELPVSGTVLDCALDALKG
jgi:hypothetical protein